MVELAASPVEPEQRPDAEELQLLTFSLGPAEYAVALGTVTEILRARALTEIPRARPPLLGVLNLRGVITPVYDPSLRLGLADARPGVRGPGLRAPAAGRAASWSLAPGSVRRASG